MLKLVRAPLPCLAFVLAATAAHAQSATPLDASDARRWREDIEFLRTEMPLRHKSLFHAMTRQQFDSALTSIEVRLPHLARHEVIVELERLAAMIGDGHSNVSPWRDSVIAFHSLPVALYDFSDGLFVRAADSAHASLVGSRVLRIGALSLDSAVARVHALISHDNAMGLKAYTPFLLAMPEVLHATGISAAADRATLVLEKDGAMREAELRAAGLFPMYVGDPDRSWRARPGWVDARERAPSPPWLSDQSAFYWYRMLPGTHAMYFQLNTIQEKPGDTLRVITNRMIAAAEAGGADRIVIDLRLNGGGDGTLNPGILLPLIKSRFDAPGHLYVLTGRRTFSAAQMLVSEMEKYTTAIFVGEPTSSHGNHFGDSYRIVMPNSRVTVRVSTLWHQYLDPRDTREMVQPAILAGMRYADYAAGRDPALAVALAAIAPDSALRHDKAP